MTLETVSDFGIGLLESRLYLFIFLLTNQVEYILYPSRLKTARVANTLEGFERGLIDPMEHQQSIFELDHPIM